jgi:uncharacterized membrane protein
MMPPETPEAAAPPAQPVRRTGVMGRLRNLVLTGLLVLVPTGITLWVLIALFNRVDNLLGRYLRFEVLDYRRIPGLGFVATLIVLMIVGWIASRLGERSLFRVWEAWLTRIPGVGILYGSTKSLGEAFFTRKQGSFKQVVLVPWPHPAMWRVGFVAGPPSPEVRRHLGDDIEVVFVPHTPNPASGFVQYAPKASLRYLDWTVEEGLRVIISAGVHQPGSESAPRAGTAVPAPGAARVS